MPHPDEADLALVALGEDLPGVAAHVAACPACTEEVLALTATVRTARGAELGALPPPPPAVWQRVSSELGLGSPAAPGRLRRRWPVVAAASLAACVAVAAVVVRSGPTDPSTRLTALGGATGRGEAVLADGRAGRVLEVDTSGLAPPQGFYEVWLLDPARDRILALGTLDNGGSARLPVPQGVDLDDYTVVDVSAEPDDGNPAHSQDSVLRGGIPL